MRHIWQNSSLNRLIELWQDLREDRVKQERELVQHYMPVLNGMNTCTALSALHRLDQWYRDCRQLLEQVSNLGWHDTADLARDLLDISSFVFSLEEGLEKTLHNRHEVAHHLFLLILLICLHHFFEKRADYVEILRHNVARADLLHAEHEDREECVFHLRVIRVFQRLLANVLDQTLDCLLKVLERQLCKALILSTKTAARHLFSVLVLDIEDVGLLLQILEE